MTNLSIIIPTFNREENIEASILHYKSVIGNAASLLNLNFEFIIIDDKSTDNTQKIIKEKFNDIKLICTKKNVGPGSARNYGIKVSQGEWIWFLDDDDKINADNINEIFHEIKNNKNSEIIAHSLKKYYKKPTSKSIKNEILKNILNFHENQEVFRYIFKKSLLNDNSIIFSENLHEDIRYITEAIFKSKNLAIVNKEIVIKQKTPGSITEKITAQRIDGYIHAYNETIQILGKDFIKKLTNNSFFHQTLGVMLYLISKENNKENSIKILKHLENMSKKTDFWSESFLKKINGTEKNSNFIYASSVFQENISNINEELIKSLKKIFSTKLSCKDLDHSLFFGPDEIRACCKRFFVNGIKKGDVVLKNTKEEINLHEIKEAKINLINKLNANEAFECSGCPYIERRSIEEAQSINYISLENFSYCNMRCSYCSPKYYSGTESRYNLKNIISDLIKSSSVSDNCEIVWGGGEPTLSLDFSSINKILRDSDKISKIRVLSNSLKYSESLEESLKDDRFHLVTSIDAGTEEKFREVRGKPGLEVVMKNLNKYKKSSSNSQKLTIKYIFCNENSKSEEIDCFIKNIVNNNLIDCLFQISCNFLIEKTEVDTAILFYELAAKLYTSGAKYVFFDDLIRDRLNPKYFHNYIINHLRKLKLDNDFIINKNMNEKIVLWGNGNQSNWIINNTTMGESKKIVGIVKNSEEYCSLKEKHHSLLIYPSGVQSYYDIIQNIKNFGLENKIYNGIIL